MCQLTQDSPRVPELVRLASDRVQQEQVEIRERRPARVADVPPHGERVRRAEQEDRQLVVVVRVAVADRAPPDEERVIEKSASAFLRRLELRDEVGELLE